MQKEFTIVTDNDAVKWLLSSQTNTHLARLAMKLQEFAPFKVIHRPGVANKNADALLRMPITAEYKDETEIFLNSSAYDEHIDINTATAEEVKENGQDGRDVKSDEEVDASSVWHCCWDRFLRV